MSEITFSDVLISPRYSEVYSRSKVDISSNMGAFTLELPVISANMRNITGAKMTYAQYQHGALGILHRFNSTKEAIEEFQDAMDYIIHGKLMLDYKPTTYSPELKYKVGVSIGVHETDKERFEKLYEYGARIFCIDVAHGHHILVKNMLTWIRTNHSDKKDIVLIGGNVATAEGALDIHSWGADIIKVGIGPGAVCQTRQNTGVGVPQLQALQEIREAAVAKNIDLKIIADGGVKTTGDIAKALKYANALMIGSLFAGTSETPGDVFEDQNGQFYKVYGGSASAENKLSSGKENKFVEGMMKTVPFRGHVKYILRRIKENVQSAFSYVGAFNLTEFQQNAEFRYISGGGRSESKL